MEAKVEPGARFLINYEPLGAAAVEVPYVRDVTVLEVSPSGKWMKVKSDDIEEWWGVEDLKEDIEELLPSVASSNPWTLLIEGLAAILAPYVLEHIKKENCATGTV